MAKVKTVYIDRPLCPHCGGTWIRKFGTSKGVQRFYCNDCKRRFRDNLKVEVEKRKAPLMCHHCGGNNTKGNGTGKRGGRIGFCFDCKKGFTQGGRLELERYHLFLEKRVKDANFPTEIRAEILQRAVMEVLVGDAYCWNVPLRTKESWIEVRGEYGWGSDHYEYKRQMGLVEKEL